MTALRKTHLVLGFAAAITGLVIGLSGYLMAGSFTVSNPEARVHWQAWSVGYAVLTLASLGCLSLIGYHLLRRR